MNLWNSGPSPLACKILKPSCITYQRLFLYLSLTLSYFTLLHKTKNDVLKEQKIKIMNKITIKKISDKKCMFIRMEKPVGRHPKNISQENFSTLSLSRKITCNLRHNSDGRLWTFRSGKVDVLEHFLNHNQWGCERNPLHFSVFAPCMLDKLSDWIDVPALPLERDEKVHSIVWAIST